MKIIEYKNIHTGVIVSEDELTEKQKEIFDKDKNWEKEWVDVE